MPPVTIALFYTHLSPNATVQRLHFGNDGSGEVVVVAADPGGMPLCRALDCGLSVGGHHLVEVVVDPIERQGRDC